MQPVTARMATRVNKNAAKHLRVKIPWYIKKQVCRVFFNGVYTLYSNVHVSLCNYHLHKMPGILQMTFQSPFSPIKVIIFCFKVQ